MHNLSGSVRNGCDEYVHGMFASLSSDYCDNSHELVAIMNDNDRIVNEFDSKASGIIATIVNITGYPDDPKMMCPSNGNKVLPEGHIKPTHAVVDWSFSYDGCSTPCDCIPQTSPVKDCTLTDPLPDGATYTTSCQRYPLGSDMKHVPDCNSIYVHNNVSCWKIEAGGTIVSSGLCGDGGGGGSSNNWVNNTLAATCCGPLDP